MSHLRGKFANDIGLLTRICAGIEAIFADLLLPRNVNISAIDPDSNLFKYKPMIFIMDVNNEDKALAAKLRGELKHKFPWLHMSNEMYTDDYTNVVKSGVNMTLNSVIDYVTSRVTTQTDYNPTRITQLQCHYQPSNTPPSNLILGKNLVNLRNVTESSMLNSRLMTIIDYGNNNKWPTIFSFDFF